MTRPTLTVVGKGEAQPDADLVALAERTAADLVASAKAGFPFWVMLDGDPPKCLSSGDPLEMAVLAEELARQMKLAVVGLAE